MDKKKGELCEYHKSITHDTGEYIVMRKEIDEKHQTTDLTKIEKDLRSKFDVEQRNTRDRKNAYKHQVKEEILTITGPIRSMGVAKRIPTSRYTLKTSSILASRQRTRECQAGTPRIHS